MTTTLAGIQFKKQDWESYHVADLVTLVPEPSNPYDPNAIKVIHDKTGIHIGYIPKVSTSGWKEVSGAALSHVDPSDRKTGLEIKTL